MRALVLSVAAVRELRQFRRRHSDLNERLDRVLMQMTEDIFQPSLKTHKLQGDMGDLWACSLNYDYRLIFEFQANADAGTEDIHLPALGAHDEVF